MEYLDVVNENDEIVGRASREDIYINFLPHRIVHVLVFNDDGRIALQQRGRNQKWCPLYWGTSVGGHVQAGETYDQAARRESREELEREMPMEFIGKYFYQRDGHTKFLGVFQAISNNVFDVNNEEVERVDFFTLDQVKDMISREEKFLPELLFLLGESKILNT